MCSVSIPDYSYITISIVRKDAYHLEISSTYSGNVTKSVLLNDSRRYRV